MRAVAQSAPGFSCLTRCSPPTARCVCCTVRGDLIKALKTLAKRDKKFDHVLIETTGLADPAPVAFVRSRENPLPRHCLPACFLAPGGEDAASEQGTRVCAVQPTDSLFLVFSFALPARCSPSHQTFFINPEVGDLYRIDSILCLVDAKHVREHLHEKKADDAVNEAVQQVAFAVRLLLPLSLSTALADPLFASPRTAFC